MGCGGSRADAIEPRYYESWTRETESTWLTNTDAEPQQQSLPAAGGPESGDADAGLKGPDVVGASLEAFKEETGLPVRNPAGSPAWAGGLD